MDSVFSLSCPTGALKESRGGAGRQPLAPEARITLPWIFPFGIDIRFELAAANELLDIPDDGTPGDPKFSGQGEIFGRSRVFGEPLADLGFAGLIGPSSA